MSATPTRRPGTAWGRLTVRTRVVITLLALTLASLTVTGVISFALQRADYQQRIDDSLTRTVDEVRILAQEGVDPGTGEPFVESDQMVYVAMLRHLPGATEGMLGMNSSGVVWTANASVPLRLEDDRELISQLMNRVGPDARPEVMLESITTSTTEYRVAIIPISFPDDAEPSVMVVAEDQRAALRTLDNTFLTYAATGLGVMIVAGLIGSLVVGRLLAPLRVLQSTAAEISGDEDLDRRVPITGSDDVARLSEDFNAMLDRLSGSFASQRQLLDDVGHELRTPITIVQGNLELMDPQDPVDVTQVRDISLDELDRVTRLTEDLVTLAKSGRPDFVTPLPLDVATLTHAVAEKAERLGPRAWTVESAAEVVHDLDEQRITQAWLQLASNAVKYSEPDTQVWIGSRVENIGGPMHAVAKTPEVTLPGQAPVPTPTPTPATGRWLSLWVTDRGIGVSAEDAQRIFERFGRGGNSSRAEGSGLGLNIVVEIARAHGGTVSVRSTPGTGSTFIMHLPLSEQPNHLDPAPGPTAITGGHP
ncbi:MAG: sensor histidine kinase [Micrococcaceae bacterium]